MLTEGSPDGISRRVRSVEDRSAFFFLDGIFPTGSFSLCESSFSTRFLIVTFSSSARSLYPDNVSTSAMLFSIFLALRNDEKEHGIW